MSSTCPVPQIPSTSNFQSIFSSALKAYERRTKTDILAHPLASQLQACTSPGPILAVLQGQADDLAQAQSNDERLTKWLNPTINVLLAFSATLGNGVSLVFSPATVIFAGAGVLLQAAKDVSAAQEALIDIFERVENFFKRLETYTEVPPTEAMTDINVKIMVEVLNILAIATKETKQGRTKKYLKKLVGRTDIEDALRRLDKLTQEEVRMATAQLLKITHGVDDKVTRIDDGVKGVEDKVKGVDAKVKGVDNKLDNVNDTVKLVLDDGKETKVIVQQTARDTTAIMQLMANDVDEVKRNQWRQDLRKWLPTPDPSTNHIITCDAQHEGSAKWFFRGSLFEEWKSIGSLLWIHGKPGSGKSVLCSAIIQDIMSLRDAGLAFMSYFYFDFKDTDKQNRRNLLLSLLSQLSARSDPCCDMLYRIYLTHDNGAHKPTDDTLIQILKDTLTCSNHGPIYIIMDALDECPNTFGLPSPRELVLDLVKGLVELALPNLHICVTSRPEIDIRSILEPLTSRQVSLHDQTGQKNDIVEYVRSVVHSDTRMGKWREEDQNLVIETLSDRADGMFRWVFCQLETLRYCFPTSLRRVLRELPKSLDETYEHILKNINTTARAHAHRLLQCLTVASRPLRLEELAEVLALDFDEALEGIPKLNADWRREDQEQAVLSTCSSLITVVYDGESRVVQFSHFSVKEFLTSDRLAAAAGDISSHYIVLEPAHMILVQACLGVLLCLDDTSAQHSSLAVYAAQHWFDHALFENVSSRVREGMESLFDLDKPYFSRWIRIHDIDDGYWELVDAQARPERLETVPVYYAALCGLRDIVEKLISKHPEHVNSKTGAYGTALHAASGMNHINVVQSLLKHGADPKARDWSQGTPLHRPSLQGHLEIVRLLLDHGADVNTKREDHWTPLHVAAAGGYFELVATLLNHNADVHAQNDIGDSPLHRASNYGHVDTARLLLDHGANPGAHGWKEETPLHPASKYGHLEIVRLLLDHGADMNTKRDDHWTPLHFAADGGHFELFRTLLSHNADFHAQNCDRGTPLHSASQRGNLEIVRLLLDLGVDVNAKRDDHWTPLHFAAAGGYFELVATLLSHKADVHAETDIGDSPLHRASKNGHIDTARLLLDHGANPGVHGWDEETPLHSASRYGHLEIVRLLLDHGADVNTKRDGHRTPLHFAATGGYFELAETLLSHNADVNALTSSGDTPLHEALMGGHIDIARLLLDHGADPEARGDNESTPLHLASAGYFEVAKLLLERGVDVDAEDNQGKTAYQIARNSGFNEIAQLLLEYGVVNKA